MIVVSDTSPVNYLILLGHVEVLARLYGRAIVPKAVLDELLSEDAPEAVRRWAQEKPDWVEVMSVTTDLPEDGLDRGEQEAISLALSLDADLLLLDERRGRAIAEARGLRVAGTLAILVAGAAIGAVALPEALERLRNTSFRVSERLIVSVLSAHGQE